MKLKSLLLVGIFAMAGLSLTPVASASCTTYVLVDTMCAYAYPTASAYGANWKFTSYGYGSSSLGPYTVTATSSKTDAGTCSGLTGGGCATPLKTAYYPNYFSSCNTVSTKVAITGASYPSYTVSRTACAGSGLVDPVGLVLDVEAETSNTVSGLL